MRFSFRQTEKKDVYPGILSWKILNNLNHLPSCRGWEFILRHKVKTTGFSRLALAAIISTETGGGQNVFPKRTQFAIFGRSELARESISPASWLLRKSVFCDFRKTSIYDRARLIKSDKDASFSRRVSGLSVRISNPPALAGGCLFRRIVDVSEYFRCQGLTEEPV